MDVEERLADLEARVDQLEATRPGADELQPGDQVTVVITDPNEDGSRDPFTKIDGVATFVQFPDDYAPSFGESVRATIADVSDTVIVAVADPR